MPLQKSKEPKSIQSFLFHEGDRIWIVIFRQHFFACVAVVAHRILIASREVAHVFVLQEIQVLRSLR
jgi:hypothetical protein